MKRIVSLLAALAVAAVAVVGAGTASAGPRASSVDIVQTAVGAGQFTTLASLLQKAGLVGTLSTGGPFTVFAPTDAAFAKVPKAQFAEPASAVDDVRLGRDEVPDLALCDALAHLDHGAAELVPDDPRRLDPPAAPRVPVVDVEVGATNGGALDLELDGAGPDLGLGDVDDVLFVALGQQDPANPGPMGREQLLFDAADRQHQPAQRYLAGHGHVGPDAATGEQ